MCHFGSVMHVVISSLGKYRYVDFSEEAGLVREAVLHVIVSLSFGCRPARA